MKHAQANVSNLALSASFCGLGLIVRYSNACTNNTYLKFVRNSKRNLKSQPFILESVLFYFLIIFKRFNLLPVSANTLSSCPRSNDVYSDTLDRRLFSVRLSILLAKSL